MIVAWAVETAATDFAIGITALAAERVCRAVRWPARSTWIVAIALMLALAGRPMIRASSEPVPAPNVVAASTLRTRRTELAAPAVAVLGRASAALGVLASTLDGEPPRLDATLIAVWILFVTLLATGSIRSYRNLLHQRANWSQERVGGIDVLVANDFGPAALGFHRAVIVIPERLRPFDAAVSQLILAHECQHATARDPLVLGWARIAEIVMPWNPVVWWAAARLRDAVEIDCDRRTIAAGAARRAYAEALVAVASEFSEDQALAAAWRRRVPQLERRLQAMHEVKTRWSALGPAIAMAVGVLATFAACKAPAPHAPDSTALIRGDAYEVDDIRVSTAFARSIPSDTIADVEMETRSDDSIIVNISTKGYEVPSEDEPAPMAGQQYALNGRLISSVPVPAILNSGEVQRVEVVRGEDAKRLDPTIEASRSVTNLVVANPGRWMNIPRGGR